MSTDNSNPSSIEVVDEPPDDDVAIGESPDGSRLNGDQARWLLTNRREFLIGLGSLAAIASIAAGDLDSNDGGGGTIYGGTMALDKAYKVGPRTYLGPDSAKDGVLSDIPDSEGWLYQAADTDVDYYLDDDTWNIRSIGSDAQPVPAVTTDSLNNADIANATSGNVLQKAASGSDLEFGAASGALGAADLTAEIDGEGDTVIKDQNGTEQYSDADPGVALADAFSEEGADTHIHLKAGLFDNVTYDNPILLDSDGQKLTGEPGAIIRAGAMNLDNFTATHGLIEIGDGMTDFEDWLVAGFEIDGNKSAHSGTADSTSHELINGATASEGTIRDLLLVDSPGDGIDFDSVTDSQIIDTRHRGHNGSAVHPSLSSARIQTLGLIAVSCGAGDSRAAYLTAGSADKCSLTGLIALDCYRGVETNAGNDELAQIHVDNPSDKGLFVRDSASVYGARVYSADGNHGMDLTGDDITGAGLFSEVPTSNNRPYQIAGAGCTLIGAEASGGGRYFDISGAGCSLIRPKGTGGTEFDEGIEADGVRVDVQNPTIDGVSTDYVTSNSGRFVVNGVGQEASSGTPTAADWEVGDLVEDSDNAGDVYLLLRDGSTWTQVAT